MPQILDYRIDMGEDSRWEIISASASAKQNLLYLQEAGLFYSGTGYYTTREGLDSYLLKLTLGGKGTLEYGGETYTMTAGDFFWIDCRNPQCYRTAPEVGRWNVLWIQFYGGNAKGYYDMFMSLNRGSPVGHLPSESSVQQLLERLLKLYRNDAGDISVDIRSAGLLNRVLTGCLEAVTADQSQPELPPVVTAIRAYLLENYPQPITLDALAQKFSISKFHLQRTFRKFVGMSPAEYLQKVRMVKAKELLRTTTLPVSMIAEQVGIESTSYFISAFRKQEDTTPLKYRAAWSNNRLI